MKTLNFKSRIKFTSFDICTGMSEAILFCPDYGVNQFITVTFEQYHYILSLCRNSKYGRRIDDSHFILDRCFVPDLINGTL